MQLGDREASCGRPNDAPCSMRAAADISAIADPQTGVATYVGKQGGWQEVGGTSAASPISAALFAAAGHADARPRFVYAHRDAFLDVIGGSTGRAVVPLCNGVTGWDGPTGVGIPDQSKLAAIGNVVGAGPPVTIAFPSDGVTVKQKFTIQAAPDPATTVGRCPDRRRARRAARRGSVDDDRAGHARVRQRTS